MLYLIFPEEGGKKRMTPFMEWNLNCLRAIAELRTPLLDTLMQGVTELGGETLFMLFMLVVFWCVDKNKGYFLMLLCFTGTAVNQMLKITFCIPRPWVLDPSFEIVESARAGATGFSFPSGHTQNAVAAYGGMFCITKKLWVRVVCMALALLIPFSRLYLGVHTPLDVGVSFVIGWLLVLAFTRQLYQQQFPVLKPGFVFLIGGLIMFFLRDEEKKPIITWEHVEQNLMWGMFFLFAGGTALGALVNGSGASEVFAGLIARFPVHNTFLLVLIIVILNVILSDVINNTACAAVTIPIVIGIAQGLSLPVIPYLWVATVSYNLSYTLPTSIRSIPIGYGLSPRYMFVRGIVLTVVMVLAVSVIGWALITFWPGFSVLTTVG